MYVFLRFCARFSRCQSGAVSVDWVALTAAVVISGIVFAYAVLGSTDNLIDSYTGKLGAVSSDLSGFVEASTPNVFKD